jgi:ABC-2 type transport system permease protein
MAELARAYRALIKSTLSIAVTYRAQIVLHMLGFVFPLIMLAVWLTVEAQTGPLGGFNRTDFISYYIAAAAVYRLTNAFPVWRWDREIRTGDLSIRLLKPLDPFHHFFSQILGLKLFDVLILVPLVGTITLLVPAVTYPLSPALVGASLCSIVVAIALNTLIGTAFGMLSFWTTQSQNFALVWSGIGQLLSGFVVPLTLFPPGLRRFAHVLPFRSMVSLPIEILMGRIGWGEIAGGLLVGISWMLVALLIYRVLWRHGLRRYEAVGA